MLEIVRRLERAVFFIDLDDLFLDMVRDFIDERIDKSHLFGAAVKPCIIDVIDDTI